MKDIDEMERMFRMIRDMMNDNFNGGYSMKRDLDETIHSYDNKSDIQEDEKKIYLTLELKVQEEDLQVTTLEDKIVIEVMLYGTWRRNTIKLPSLVEPKSAKISFKNFILDIVLDKKEVKKDVNEKI